MESDVEKRNDLGLAKGLEPSEWTSLFTQFFEQTYQEDILRLLTEGAPALEVDFGELSKFNPELAEDLLEKPEEVIEAAEYAIRQFESGESGKGLRVRIFNASPSQQIRIRDVRSEHLKKMLVIEGTVRQKSDVRPQVTEAKFECPSCGNILNVLQLDEKFKEPSKCGCGRKGKFRLLQKQFVDAQSLMMEESADDLDGGEQPKRLRILLKNDLVSPLTEKKTNPGSKVILTGYLKEVPIVLRSGGQSVRFDIILEANNVEANTEEFGNIEITEEDKEEILEFSRDPKMYDKLREGIAPSIYGHDRIKEALVLQLMGGVRKKRSDGVVTRGDMHILLIGDPGSGKSMMLKRIDVVAPKSRFISGKGVSGAGLCVAPDSTLLTNPGGMHNISDVVENQHKGNKKRYCDGVWQAKNTKSEKKILTLDENLKVKPREIEQFWKLKAPEEMVAITSSLGKRIEITANTQLYTIEAGKPGWKKSLELEEGDYIATARNTDPKNSKETSILDLISSNPVVIGAGEFVQESINILLKKYGTKRNIARVLNFNEHNLYATWPYDDKRGNIHLNDLKKIAQAAEMDSSKIARKIKGLSLYRGKSIQIPTQISEELCYFAGLVAGDGDLSRGKNTVSIRFSNSNTALLELFGSYSKKLFGVNPNRSRGSSTRPPALRFASLIVAEILNKLGVPCSPKSHLINPTNELLMLPKPKIAAFLRGLYDSDGTVFVRKGRGSSGVEYTTTSKPLADKIHLLLLRWGVISRIRERLPRPSVRIRSKHPNHVITITGKNNLELFQQYINFNHPEKKTKLLNIIQSILKPDTNIDIVPGAQYIIKEAKKVHQVSSRKLVGRKTSAITRENISRERLQKIANSFKQENCSSEQVNLLHQLANSDIVWEKVATKEIIPSKYDYVYDLTVADSHNFVVNGVLVHNTATVVKDEFMSGWSLEAGAMVLANKGILCCHPETNVYANGEVCQIRELFDESRSQTGKVKGKEIEYHPVNIPVVSVRDDLKTNFSTASTIARKYYKGGVYRVKFDSGFEIVLTPKHQVLDGKTLTWKPINSFSEGDSLVAPRKIPGSKKRVLIFDLIPSHWKVMLTTEEKNKLKKEILQKFKSISEANRYFGISRHVFSGGNQLTLEQFKGITQRVNSYETWKMKPLAFGRNKAGERLKISHVTPGLAYFLGFVYGDGSVRITKRRSNIHIVQSKAHQSFIDRVKEYWDTFSHRKLGEYEKLMKSVIRGQYVESDCVTMYNGSNLLAHLYDFFTQYSLAKLQNMDDACISAFIAGAMDSDGCICTKSKRIRNKKYYTTHIDFLLSNDRCSNLNFMLALRRLDVHARITSNKRNVENIRICSREDVERLVNAIRPYSVKAAGHILVKKRKNITGASSKIPQGPVADICRYIAMQMKKTHLLEKGIWSAVYDFAHMNRVPSRNELTRILSHCSVPDTLKEKAECLLREDYFLDKIVQIKQEPYEGYVYDLHVLGVHNFLAGGITIHNCIDEMDKMSDEDRAAMHESLEGQTITISKANVQATLRCETTVLAAANPKFGRFDPYGTVAEQIDLPPTLINRFDLIFPVKDLPDEIQDAKLAKFVLDMHKNVDKKEEELPTIFIRKYLAYAKQNINPRLTDAAMDEIKRYYLQMRATGGKETKTVPISARQLEGLVRMSEAVAKTRLSKKVERKDAQRAVALMDYCLRQIAFDEETGQIDIDKIASGVPAAQRNKIITVKEIINELEKEMGKSIPIEEIVKHAEEKGIQESDVEEAIEKLKRTGDIFEPRKGFLSRI